MLRPRWFHAAVLLLPAALYGWNLGWGLPGEARSAAYFPRAEESAELFRRMAASRRAIGGSILDHNRAIDREAALAGRSVLAFPPGRLPASEHALAVLRALRVAPPGVDESHVLAALSTMRPAELRVDPHTLVYGGLFLYGAGAVIAAGSLAGAYALSPDVDRYLERPEEIGRMLVAGRALVAACAAAAVFLFWRLAALLAPPGPAALAALLFALSPAMLANAVTLKPHAFALPFLFGSFLVAFRRPAGGLTPRAAAACGALAGLAAGAAASCALGLAPLLLRTRRAKAVAALLAGAAAAFFLTNPYLLIEPRRSLAELASWSAEQAGPGLGLATFGRVAWGVLHVLPASAGLAAAVPLWIGLLALRGGWKGKAGLWLLSAAGLLFVSLPMPWGARDHAGRQGVFFLGFPILAGLVVLHARLGSRPALRRGLAAGAALLAASTALLYAWNHAAGQTPAGNAQRAGDWIVRNVPKGATVAMNQMPHPFLAPRFDHRDYDLRVCRSREELAALDRPPACLVRMRHSGALPDGAAAGSRIAAVFERPRWHGWLGVTECFVLTNHDFEILVPESAAR